MPLKRPFPPKSKDKEDDDKDSKAKTKQKTLPPWLRKGKK